MYEESKEEIKRLLAEEKLELEWNSYMRCNGLPNANDPSDLRKYIHMWIDDVKKLSKKEINWLLKTNEQSILTQDQSVVDLSRANLKQLQPEVGDMYAKRTYEVLGILDEMDAVIRDRYSLSPNKMDDLLDVSEIEFDFQRQLFCGVEFVSCVTVFSSIIIITCKAIWITKHKPKIIEACRNLWTHPCFQFNLIDLFSPLHSPLN